MGPNHSLQPTGLHDRTHQCQLTPGSERPVIEADVAFAAVVWMTALESSLAISKRVSLEELSLHVRSTRPITGDVATRLSGCAGIPSVPSAFLPIGPNQSLHPVLLQARRYQ